MAVKKGKCINFGSCEYADSGEVLLQDSSDFLCPECGNKLKEVIDPDPPKKWIVLVAVFILLILSAVWLIPGSETGDGDAGPVEPDPEIVEDVDVFAQYKARVNGYLNRLAEADLPSDEVQEAMQEALSLFENAGVDVHVVTGEGTHLENLTIENYLSKQRLLQRDKANITHITLNPQGKISSLEVTESRVR